MSQYDNFKDASKNTAEDPAAEKGTSSIGQGFNSDSIPYMDQPEDQGDLKDAEEFKIVSALYQGTTSVVPHEMQNSPRALAPAESISPAQPKRIPHFGHLALLLAFLIFGFLSATALMLGAYFFHLDGVTTTDQIKTNVYYLLGFEVILYLVALALCIPLFPLLWTKSFFAGIHWRGAAALRSGWWLLAIAAGCFLLAMLDIAILPGPAHAPIEEIFRSPGAAWLMFAFGVTIAPFSEEIGFRGFLLPSFATACDWVAERFSHNRPRPLDDNGHPQWSLPAMVIASIASSLPFALIHVAQQGHSLGPFLQVLAISLVLCAVRLRTRSLAASTLVHAVYNFLIFSAILIGTDGFRHFDKM
jgi:membrane protease YdiL (CAAX protease family)